MALQKQPIPINFIQGLDLKTDPYQVSPGKFLTLNNSVFTAAGRLTKRNGFADITQLPDGAEQINLATLNGSLLTTGASLYSFNQETDNWINQGIVQPVQLSVSPIIRSGTSQSAPDIAISSSGLACSVYLDNGAACYQIADSQTGQQLTPRTLLPTTSTCPRVFVLGVYFIVTYLVTVGSTPTLQFIAIPILNPTAPKSPIDISVDVGGLAAGYDCYATNNQLFVAWGRSTAAIGFTYVSSNLAVQTSTTISGMTAEYVSVTLDTDLQRVWITYTHTTTTKTTAYTYNKGELLAPTTVLSGVTINELTSAVKNDVLNVFYQVTNIYGDYNDSAGNNIRTDFIGSKTITIAGVVSSQTIILRSVGLASKAFMGPNNTVYMLAVYGDTAQTNPLDNSQQSTYFLIDGSGHIYMRLAYSNAGGYKTTQVLPNVVSFGGYFYTPYQITDFLTTTNKGTNLPAGTPINAIYTQTGINLAKIGLNIRPQYSSEIAGSLHLTGGQLWQYDGIKPVEHNFHLWPENVVPASAPSLGSMTAGTYNYVFTYEWTDSTGNLQRSAPSIPVTFTFATPPGSFTGTVSTGVNTITSVSSFTGLEVGQVVIDAGILPANTYIISMNVSSNTILLSANSLASGSAMFTVSAATAIRIHVPTLRLTYKTSPNPVRIVGYRWSVAQQVYYQFTSVTSPNLNNTAIDDISITDTLADASILGNAILYTTGGVIENIAAPASIASALFSNRLFLIDAEDQNLLWFSKQVIENTPVEMSDLLTLYVAPTTGAQGSTGPMTALSAMDDKLIIFKKDAIYYINGSGPDNTGANSTFSDPVYITGTVGCVNPSSIVLMPNGIMFQSDKGIWLLERGLSTKYIGAAVEAYNNQQVTSATIVPGTNEVRFVLDTNVTLMYDYYFDQWATHSNIYAISSTLYQGLHTYLNQYGHVFQEASGTYTDGSQPVLMSLTTSWIAIAGIQGFERFYSMNLLGTYFSPFKLNIGLAYNYNSSAIQNTIVTPSNYAAAWGEEALWGSGGPWGGSEGNVFTARLFPEKQKCQSFQVSIQEIYDSSLGVAAGQGLSLSGMVLTIGAKRGTRTQSAAKSFG